MNEVKYTKKKMLKNSVFISTLILVIITLFTLSTATFAWFSANSRVGVGQLEFYAQTADSARIYIGWTSDATTNSITFANPENIAPMVPFELPIDAATANPLGIPPTQVTTPNSMRFVSGSIDGATNLFQELSRREYCLTYPTGSRPYVCKRPEYTPTQEEFYVRNGSATNAIDIVATALIAGNNAEYLRTALFINNEYAGTLSATVNYTTYWGQVTEGADATAAGFSSYNATSSISFRVNMGEYVTVKVVAWYDGVMLLDEHAGNTATYTLNFNGTEVTGG